MESIRGISPEGDRRQPNGRWELLVVPQLEDVNSKTDPRTAKPISELLLPVWIPDGIDIDNPPPIPDRIAKIASEAPWLNDKSEYLRYKFPPHRMIVASVEEYDQNNCRQSQRGKRAQNMGDRYEWVTAIFTMSPDGPLYEGLSDDEFDQRFGPSGDRRNTSNVLVLGQTIRPTSSDSTILHESNTRLGLFGIANEAIVHMPALATDQSIMSA